MKKDIYKFSCSLDKNLLMMMYVKSKNIVFVVMMICLPSFIYAQSQSKDQVMTDKEIRSACEKNLPKMWKELQTIERDDVPIVFNAQMHGPGRAKGKVMELNPEFFIKKNLEYPEDRLLIVIVHEYGHILFNRIKDDKVENLSMFDKKIENEYQAFKYSVEWASEYAKNGDKGPLEQVITNLKSRAASGKEDDPHTHAIKRLMGEPVWKKAEEILISKQAVN
ncbi:hypothetical protein ACP3T3_04360 [Chryseobacterium sp. CBSDS_008]|uniref:hypothetical protein n=1 Tax=Chryseobacterium sp. CBSDS_008 TaxID=3415265 RepID=UPI003CEA6251